MYLLSDILQEFIPDLWKKRLHPVKVAILDTGIDGTHEVLRGKIDGVWEFRDDCKDENGVISPLTLSCGDNHDDSAHGTAVASIVSRIAPNARLLDYKVMTGSWTGENVIAGLSAAIDSDAHIINMSMNCPESYSRELEDLLEKAYQKHKIIIASRRNSVNDIPIMATAVASDVGFPAELAACIGVDNMNYENNPYIIEVINTPPIGVTAHGVNILVAKSGGGYHRVTNTSYATPVVTGIVALLLGRYPELELFEIKSIIKYHFQNKSFNKFNVINPLEVAIGVKKVSTPLAGAHACPKCWRFVIANEAFSFVKCPDCGHVFPILTDLDRKVYDDITDKLTDFGHKKCCYHDVRHTREVVANVLSFMQRYPRLSAVSRKCLMTSALLHDYGYIDSYEANETLAAQFATDYLPYHGYSEQEIEQVKTLILATAQPVSPKNLLERILCDADIGHIGLPSYWERTNLLRREREEHGIRLTDAEWLKEEIHFLSNHHFFQKWLESERRESREQTIRKLSKMLKKSLK